MKEQWKVFVMAIVGFVATTVSQAGNGGINFWYVLLATVAFIGLYAVKNFFFPATSDQGLLNWKDLVSGLLIAVFMAISSFASSVILTGVPDWHALWIAVVGAVTGYFAKTFAQGSKV